MKFFGIICEYDPLHYGHVRQINYTRQLVGKNGIIVCIMSGNFVQRGLPSVLDKFTRAKHAILAGADAVIELPTLYATASATDFALGGVKILNQLNADGICCGSESGDKKQLLELSNLISSDDTEFNEYIKELIKQGNSYPLALSMAEQKFLDTNLLCKPNNLLAVEYLNAINKTGAKLTFETIKRDSDYFDQNNTDNCSSSAIRKAFENNDLQSVAKHLPDFVYQDLLAKSDHTYRHKYENLVPTVIATKTKKEIGLIVDVNEGIENLLYENLDGNYENFIANLKTKRYTRARLNRILLHTLLNVTKDDHQLKFDSTLPTNILAIKNDEKIIAEVIKRINASQTNSDLTHVKINQITQRADRVYNTMYNIVLHKNDVNRLKKY